MSENGLTPDHRVADNNAPVCVLPKASPVWIMLLLLATFGLYGGFWMVARARELKAIGPKEYIPWLWFFVPSFFLAELFALPKIMGHIRDLSSCSISKAAIYSWIISALIVSFLLNLEHFIELALWMSALLILFHSILFYVAQVWINTVKELLESRITFYKPNWIRPAQIVVLILGLCFWSFVGYVIFIDLKESIYSRPLSDQQWILPEGHDVKFKVIGDFYKEVPIDNDDQLIHIDGKYLLMKWYLFDYGFNETIDSMLINRFSEVYKNEADAECHSEKIMIDGGEDVLGIGYCEYSYMGDPGLAISSLIYSPGKGLYELHGEFSSTSINFHQNKKDFIRMAKWLRIK